MKLNKVYRLLLAAGVAGSMLGLSGVASASGFQLFEQDSSGLGLYHAGYAVNPNDSASAGFYNPAALTVLKGQQLSVGAVGIQTSMRYYGTVNGVSVGNTNNNGGVFKLVPNLAYAAPINSHVVFGFNITTPFGLATIWPKGSQIANYATKTSMTTVDVSPSLGVKINDHISVGAGFDAEYINGEFDNFIGAASLGDNNSGHSWGYGGHGGVMFTIDPNTRIGLSYHSQIVQHLKGKSEVTDAAFPVLNSTSNNLRLDVTLPAYWDLSAYHKFGSQWALMATAMYTQWSVFKNLTLKNLPSNLNLPNNELTIPQNFKNTWNFALGGQYFLSKKWTLELGTGYDQSPTNNTDRNLRLPDSNRIALSVGALYHINKKFTVSAGYMHLFMLPAAINNTPAVATDLPPTVGTVKSSANIFGLQFTWNIT